MAHLIDSYLKRKRSRKNIDQ